MKIGIIGAHIVGMRLATEFARTGHEVVITNSRGPESVKQLLEQLSASSAIAAGSMAQVLDCELVVLAAPWIKREEVLAPRHDWAGRILLDTTNIYLSYPPNYEVDRLGKDSGSEIISRLAPGARVVKAFNTLDFGTMFAPVPNGMRRVLFIAGDDKQAVNTVGSLIDAIGLHPVPLGPLESAGRLMELEAPLSLLEVYAPVKTPA